MLTPMKWRCPDKPNRISQDKLKGLAPDFIATAKYDGWRCVIDWDGKWVEFYSRRGPSQGGPTTLPINSIVAERVLKFLQDNQIPPNTRLDAEWIGRRSGGGEGMVILGVQYYNGQWTGTDPEKIRWALVQNFKYNEDVVLAESTEQNYSLFFEGLRDRDLAKPTTMQEAEGIVLKHKNSKLIGNIKESAQNPLWLKAKWRDGPDGKGASF